MHGFTLDIVVIDFCTLYHYATVAIIFIPNLYYICTLAYLGNVFTFIQYRTCYICPGLVFRYEFNGGVYFGIGLTKKGNFLVLYVFHTIFQYEFNCNGDYVIQWPFLPHHMIWVCSDTIFQNEFNGGDYNTLRETNLVHYMIWASSAMIFYFAFNCNAHRVIRRLFSHIIQYGYHLEAFSISHAPMMVIV